MKKIYTLGRFGLMGLLLAFAVVLNAQPGGWSVNFSQYQYNMTITAQIQVNGVPNHALNNHLAVFSKGQIRGYATPVAINGQAYYFMTAYANTYQGDTLYFRAFIGSEQKIYESTDTVIFRHQKIVGKISAPLPVHLFLGARPLIYSLSEVNYGINACTDVLDVQSSDNINSEGNGLTYSIIGGADASKFTINPVTGVISWYNFTPVFTPPGDANGDNKYEVKIKVTDASGLSDVQNLTVKIVQESPLNPLVCPASFTLNTSADGLGDCSAKTDQTQIYALNPCDLFGMTYTLTGATTGSGSGQIPLTQSFQKGVTTATYLRGASSQCSFTVTVVDNEVPTITCPTNKTVNTLATPPCAAVVNNIDAVYADNCTGAFLSYTYTGAGTGTGTGQLSGKTFPVGLTQVVYKATDAANLTSTCTFSITVVDAILPVALCKNATVQLNQSGTATIVASDIDNGSSDNCGIGTLSALPNSFTCANAGNNTVTLTVTDINNNISTCTATVLVKSLSLGNQVFKDLNRNGLFDAGDTGVNGVLCKLYADNGNGTLDAGDGPSIASFTTTTLNGQAGSYLFSLLCPGDYIVEIAPSNFNVGGPLYDNTLQAPLVSSPFNGAPDPDNNVNNDDNGEAVSGFGVASQAITLALNLEPDNDGDTDKNTNLSLDFGFKTAASVSIGDVTLAEGTGGTTTAYNFTVTRSDNLDALSLVVNTQIGTAVSASDYTAINNGTVSFTAGGSLTATVTVLVNQDNMVEPNETFTVNLTDPSGNVYFTDASGLGTITNDDNAVVTLSGGTAQTEGTALTFTATLNNPVQGGFSVAYTSNDGTATTADNDYTDNDGSLTFAGTAGEIKTITVNTTSDNKVELDETFTVALGSITGAPTGVSTAGSPKTGTITNDDAATVSIAANISQSEATSPQAFSVTLSNPVDAPVTVQFSTSNGTATTADNDYVGITGQTVTFPAGTTTAQTANVTINNDNKVEADELYNVAIGSLSASGRNVTLGTSSRTGTILNDDAAVLTLSGGIAKNEGNSGTVAYIFTATLDNPVQGGFTANYTTNDGTAISGSDYTDNDGSLSFAGTAGEAKTVTVNVNGDVTVELNETFTVVFGTIIGAPAGLSTAGSPQTGTITNDDAATVSIAANVSQSEASSPQAFSVTLTNPVDVAVSVQFSTSNGTATTADNDYVGITAQTVTFAAGSTTAQTVNVTINNDNKVEADELYNVAIGTLSASGRNVTLGNASRTGTILNDDVAVVTLSGGIAKNEGNTGTTSYVFTATLDNPVQGGFSLAYTTNDGTATTANNDYTDNDGSLSFAGTAGEAKTITVNVNGDVTVELDEAFTVALGSITGAPAGVSTAGSPQTGTITNDDAASVSIAANISQSEATSPQAFSVTLTNPVDVAVSVQFSTSNGTATTADNDYVGITGQTVTFAAGSTTAQTANVTINNDNKVEADELYNVAIGSLSASGRNVTLGTSTRTGTILNDDAAVVTLSGGIAKNEGNTGPTAYVFTATLDNPVQGGFSVAYTTNDGSATTANSDYTDNDGSLSFAGTAGEAKIITVSVTGDVTVELDEAFTVALGSITGAPAGVSTAGSPQTGTITNDDAATVSIAANISQAEATSPQAFSVTLTNPVDVAVSVQFSTANGTATTADNDYVGITNQVVTFAAGSTTAQTVNVTINNDNKVEADEVYNVAIGTLSASGRNVTLGSSSRTGTILNDDAAVVTLSGGIAKNEGNTGTTAYVFTATLDNPVQGGFSVAYTTNDGTATTANSDYTDNDGSLSFAGTAGEAKTITVNVTGDVTVELDEAFTVALGAITGAPAGVSTAGSPQTGTITNDDAATVSIAANVSQSEATSPQAFSVTLTNPVDVAVSVQFSTSNGTATTADNDYVGITNQIVTFPAGTTTAQTANVTITNDNKVEADEVYNVAIGTLSASGRNVTLGNASRTGTILNDDAAVVTLSGGIAKNEGNTGTTAYVFTATLDNPVQGGFSVAYTTNDGTATTLNSDYTDNDGSLSFAGTAGEAKTVTVNVTGDVTVELDEAFTVALGAITGAPAGVSTAGSPQTGTITNDDAATVSIAANISQAEAISPQAFSVTLTNPVDVAVSVQFSTSNGTATTADNDYNGITAQTVTFPAGSTTAQTANVTINNDNKVEADEVYNVAIGTLSASGRNVTLGTSTRTGTILNDDAAVVTLSGGIAKNEGNTGTTAYVFTATLDNPVQGGFTANYTTNDGTATTAGSDYTDNDGALSFAGTAGEAKTITVNVTGDVTVELDETFTVALGSITGSPAGVSTAGSPQTGTITNDDAASVSIAANISQSEASSPQAFSVTLTNPVDVAVSVQFSTSNGTATTADNDYVGITAQTVTFPAGSTTAQSANVTINNDNKVEADEVYNVAIGTLSANGRNVTLGTTSRTGTILNDDAAVVTLSGGIVQNEGNTGTTAYVFTATLSNPVQGGFTANYSTNDGTATTADNDYTDNDGALSFVGSAGETKTFTVLVNGDLNIEANETFQTAINTLTGIPTPPAVTIAGSPQTATITNDELDFGDAPTSAQSGFAGSYPTSLANNGARHGAAPGGLRLGASIDADLDGQPNATASGDGADEDGVTLPAVLVTSNNANVTVNASAAGILNAWVDFNRDGDWADAGEQVFTNQSVSAGSNSLSFAVPAVVSVGTSFARFRLATAPGLSFDGPAADGEVEDYVVSIVNTQFSINDPVVTEGNAGTSNLSFVISRTVNSGACSVNYAITGGTATTADNDYQTLAAGTASFTAGGALTQTINVVVNGDLKVELNETVDMTLSNPVNASILDGAGTGTITNDDAATITITNPTVTEGDVSTTVNLSYTITMSNPSDANVEMGYTTVDGTATVADNDYASAGGNLIFSPGQVSKTVTVTANGDCKIETDENFLLRLSALINNSRNVSFSGGGATLNGTGTINNDDALPVITCPGNFSKNVDAGTCTTSILLPLPTTSSICGTSTLEFRYRTVDAQNNPTGAFTAFAPSSNNTVVFNSGRYEVEWRVTDGSGSSSCSFILTVIDNQPPTIACPANQFVNASASCTGLVGAWTPVSLNDNCTPIGQIVVTQTPVASTELTGHGTSVVVTLTAKDLSNNTASCTFSVTLRDVTPPVAKCKTATANLGSNGLVTVLPASVDNGSSDNCTFTSTLTPNTFSCSNIGQNTVTFKATDAGGNTATCTTKVTVVDNTPPTAKCKNATIFLNSVGQATLTPADVNNGSSDNCSIGTLTISKSTFNCSEISGTNPVTLTLTDANGNSSSCIAYVTVKDNLAPTAVCQNTTVTLNSNGKVSVYPATLAGNSFDNCSVFSYSPTVKVYTTANIGNNNLTITVKDFTGNASTCVSVVTVLPNVINNDDRAGEDQQAATAPVHLSLFPNPTTGDATLQFDLPADQEFSVLVFDLSGRLVYNQKDTGKQGENALPIRLSGLASGIYLLDFQTDAIKSHVRLVVQK